MTMNQHEDFMESTNECS